MCLFCSWAFFLYVLIYPFIYLNESSVFYKQKTEGSVPLYLWLICDDNTAAGLLPLQGLIMLLQYMLSAISSSLVGVHMLLASMICMFLICKLWDYQFILAFFMIYGEYYMYWMFYGLLPCWLHRWNGQDLHNKVRYRLHELDMQVLQLERIGSLLVVVTTRMVCSMLPSFFLFHSFHNHPCLFLLDNLLA